LVGLGLAAQVGALAWLQAAFDQRQVLTSYRRVQRVNVLSATALGAYLVARLALGTH
jgi:hypothetical protein